MAKKAAKATVIETPVEPDPVAVDEREAPASAGPTPEMQANDPPEAFEPDPNEDVPEPRTDGHPSAGPTPEDQKNDPKAMFKPAPEPKVDDAVEPVAPVPSAGPTPEDIAKLDEARAEADKAAKAAEKAAPAHERARKAAAEQIEKLIADGHLSRFVETASSPDDQSKLLVNRT